MKEQHIRGLQGGHFSLGADFCLSLRGDSKEQWPNENVSKRLKMGLMYLLALTQHNYFTQVNMFLQLAALEPKHVTQQLGSLVQECTSFIFRNYFQAKQICCYRKGKIVKTYCGTLLQQIQSGYFYPILYN
ncbi:uncharacterized protein LOC116962016 isoform X3 [Tyto alba]|uniref:uncharacterized protein LOC116962016 isoform X3 n=1 Tax=Tyto alba TaxID=56313 RepID=UPI001C676155|nr:uncharacterized protein LOC116962016 isoform X3 [Tyto alba]